MPDKPIALEDRALEGARMFSPSAGRNKKAIAEALSSLLPDQARVLEVGSGTGEHGAALGALRSDIIWQYSDPDPQSRQSQKAWAREDWPDPLALDLTQTDWSEDLPPFDAIFSANMIHIAPIEAAYGLAKGAAKLADTVLLYGPFLFGADSAPSNLDFDRSLRARDPAWGVRELGFVKHIFEDVGFNCSKCYDMPSNNHLVRLSKR